MAGPNMELFRFGFYVFFPVAMMLQFGDPEWYNTYVVPYGRKIFPDYDKTNKPPHTSSELHVELERLKAQRIAKTDPSGRIAAATASATSSAANAGFETVAAPANVDVNRQTTEGARLV